MKAFLWMLGFFVNILASNCNELTAKTIKTYVISDSSVFMKDGTKLIPSTEVFLDAWAKIPNTYWIWCTSDFFYNSKTIVEFNKVFNVPGKITSAKIEFLVDNILTLLIFNGNRINDYLISSSHQIISTNDITDLLHSGISSQ